jgi:hypothetical protein
VEHRRAITPREVRSLNQVGVWLAESALGKSDRLGDVFAEALRDDRTRTLGNLAIGSPGGLDGAVANVAGLKEAAAAALAALGTGSGLSQCYELVEKARQAFQTPKKSEELISSTFLAQLSSNPEGHRLNAALNELLALFKAAPWAYRDLHLEAPADPDGGSPREELGIGSAEGAQAELRLNTSELNSLTLALFLLCAPRVPNCLRLLILDDPLQNMDEMTVTAVAQGLGRVLRLYPPGWQILALFHGEDGLERIRQEIRCAVYRLPWLRTGPVNENEPIRADPELSTWGITDQSLKGLVDEAQIVSEAQNPA